MPAVIEVRHLHKSYGADVAVDDVSFTVEQGEIFGILGPNGAGKTTTVECVEGLRTADRGEIRVLGLDPRRDRAELTQRLGVQLQDGQLPDRLRVGEALRLYGSFYRKPADRHALMDVLGLADKRRTPYAKLSGGQQQRLSIALALIGGPEVAVLDELTTGLDPQARRDTWDLIEDVRARGVTIMLVTHFMEEAERLCDRVAVIDRGRVVAVDSPAALTERLQDNRRIRFRPSVPFEDCLLTALPDVTGLTRRGDVVMVTGNGNALNAVTSALARNNIVAEHLRVEQPSLEDAFVALTGDRAAPERAPPGTDPATRRASRHPSHVPAPVEQKEHLMSVSTPVGPAPPATDAGSLLGRLTLTELKLFVRERVGPVFAIGLPLLLLTVFGNIPYYREHRKNFDGFTLLDLYVPILAAFVLATLSFNVMPAVLAGYREKGVLRRLRTTPVGPARVLAAQLLVNLATAAVSVAALLLVARFAFGVLLPREFGGYLISIVLAALALVAIGLFVAAASPNGRIANAVGATLFYVMMFFAGLFLPIAAMPPLLRHISQAAPLGAAVQALTDATEGHWPHPVQLVTLAAYAVVFGAGAVKWFRWE